MAQDVSARSWSLDPRRLPRRVALRAAALGVLYAAGLAALERQLPIKPTWVALEVIGGVALVGLPVMKTVRTAPAIGWRDYERLVIAGFIGAGLPICVWQAIEYGLLRRG